MMERLQAAAHALPDSTHTNKTKSQSASLADSEDTGFASMTSPQDDTFCALDDVESDSSDDAETIVSSRYSFSDAIEENGAKISELLSELKPTRFDKLQRKPSPLTWKTPPTLDKIETTNFTDESEFDINRKELRKTSSLKAQKTPPGTPSQQKYVRFADALGLDLTSVRLMRDQESPPRVPESAFKHLSLQPDQPKASRSAGSHGALYLAPWFGAFPGSNPGFIEYVLKNKVLLERIHVTDLALSGTVRVANLSYNKLITVRHTCDGWVTQYDQDAVYVPGSSHNNTDAFSFTLRAPPDFCMGGRLEFCIRYLVANQEFWDSNKGHNYVLECYARLAKVLPEQAGSAFDSMSLC